MGLLLVWDNNFTYCWLLGQGCCQEICKYILYNQKYADQQKLFTLQGSWSSLTVSSSVNIPDILKYFFWAVRNRKAPLQTFATKLAAHSMHIFLKLLHKWLVGKLHELFFFVRQSHLNGKCIEFLFICISVIYLYQWKWLTSLADLSFTEFKSHRCHYINRAMGSPSCIIVSSLFFTASDSSQRFQETCFAFALTPQQVQQISSSM